MRSSLLVVGVEGAGTGSATSNSIEEGLSGRFRLVGVAYETVRRTPTYTTVQADGRALPFVADAFDFVFSNAVLEHLGDETQIQRFLAEARRVARVGSMHTTPNRWHPIDLHTLLPLLHWLPRRLHPRLLHNARFAFTDNERLLSRRDLRRLAPNGRVTGATTIWPMTLWLDDPAASRPIAES